MMEWSSAESCDTPPEMADVCVTIGIDGRLYCHDITPELIPVLAAVCGDDPELVARYAAGALLEYSA